MGIGWKGWIIALACFTSGLFLGYAYDGFPSGNTTVQRLTGGSVDSTVLRSAASAPDTYSGASEAPARPSPSNDDKLNQRSTDEVITEQINTLRWIQQADAASLREWLIESANNNSHDYLTERVALHRLTDLDPNVALALFDHPDFNVQGLSWGVMARLAATNLPLALSAFEALPKHHQENAARGILDGHRLDDQEAWIAIYEQLAPYLPNQGGAAIWATRTVRENPEAVFALLLARPDPLSDDGIHQLRDFSTIWLMEDAEAAMVAIRNMPTDLREKLIRNFGFNGLPTSNPDRGLRILLEAPDDTFDSLIPGSIRNYAGSNPEEAMQMAESLEGEIRKKSINAVIEGWSWKAPEDAAAWVLANFDETDALPHIKTIATRKTWKSASEARMWARSLNSPSLRQAAEATIDDVERSLPK